MSFRTHHDLLVYLVELSDSDDAWRLKRGSDLMERLLADGLVERSEKDFANLGRFLWRLKEDGSVTFTDWVADNQRKPRNPHAALTYNDLVNAWEIAVTSHGRIATQASRPAVSINVANLDMTILLGRMEEEILTLDAPDDEKEQARSRLRAARDLLGGVGSGATAEILGAALRRALGLP